MRFCRPAPKPAAMSSFTSIPSSVGPKLREDLESRLFSAAKSTSESIARGSAPLRWYPAAWRNCLPALRRFHRAHSLATGHRFKNGFLEQIARLLAEHEQRNRGRPRRCAKQGDVVRITTERPDVLMNLTKRCDLVHHAVICDPAVRGAFGKRGMREPTECSQAIVQRDHDDPCLRELRSVEQGIACGTGDEGSAMNLLS